MYPKSIAVTGANGQVGRSTLAALVRKGVKVTALVRRPESFTGCRTIVDWLISDDALVAIREAEAVIHLAGTLNPPDHNYEMANITPTERLASALDKAITRRLIFLSYVAASEKSRNRYLAGSVMHRKRCRNASLADIQSGKNIVIEPFEDKIGLLEIHIVSFCF